MYTYNGHLCNLLSHLILQQGYFWVSQGVTLLLPPALHSLLLIWKMPNLLSPLPRRVTFFVSRSLSCSIKQIPETRL